MRLIIPALTLALLTCPLPAVAQWTVIPLRGSSGAEAINNDGVVVGGARMATGATAPALWADSPDPVLFLGPVNGLASNINNRDQIVGYLFGQRPDETRGFLWSAEEGLTDLGEFIPREINDQGMIVGLCGPQFCTWANGRVRIATTSTDRNLPEDALGINNRGDLAGSGVGGPQDNDIALRLLAGQTLTQRLPSPPGASYAIARDINDQGLALGTALISGSPRLLVWDAAGRLLPGPSIPAFSVAINNVGVVLGLASEDGGSFLWRVGERPQRLSRFARPTGLNDRGDMVGTFNGVPAVWRLDAKPLRISTPNTASAWGIGTRQRLAWRYDGEATQFLIEVSRDGGELWDFVEVVANRPGTSQSYYWTVTGPAAPNARMRVTALVDEEATDTNNALIKIAPAFVEVLRPLPNRPFNHDPQIFFKHNLGARVPVAIDISADGGRTWSPLTITETTGSTTSAYRRFIFPGVGPHQRVRVRALDGSGAMGLSGVFSAGAGGVFADD